MGIGIRVYTGTPHAPCKGCTERKAGCHPQCERYKQYRSKLNQCKDKRSMLLQDAYNKSFYRYS